MFSLIRVSFPVSPIAVRLSQLLRPRFPSLSRRQVAAQLRRSSTLRVVGGIGVSVSFISLDSDLASLKSNSSRSELIFAAFGSFVFPVLLSVIFPVIRLANPIMNPVGPGALSLAGLGCEKILVCVARKDKLRDKGVRYYEGVKKSGWKGILELFEEEEGHVYHIQKPQSENSHKNIKRLGLEMAYWVEEVILGLSFWLLCLSDLVLFLFDGVFKECSSFVYSVYKI